ncbi:DUF2254 domain-containing protein [Neisseria dumasiana]|uniref:DUF2254 domain-containing protein n=1 Tax=Neisseria dumasiana TaxID=1931275 RepID=A0ABX3WP39_9NEIS|nr:DUF2254 family protein [Neisseria dumasiana]OSI36663.1 hypothetical protein BV913_01275 [Neisseria dumasiana]UOO85267.1 DUF2254 domain-containing protein [Neisseria dumasiana]
MMYRWLLALKKPSNRLWVTPALWALVAVLFAFGARLATIWLPANLLPQISLSTLESLLEVIASSMLAVSTFSLSIMVSAFSSAANGATPRATELVMSDDNTRTAIASFISAFIYAIIAKTALGMEFYGQNGRFVLFVSTVLVLAYLIVTLIRWVHTISQLGGMAHTVNKILKAAEESLDKYRADPNMGAGWRGSCSNRARMVQAGHSGYLTHIDMASLQSRAEDSDVRIHILVRPGELVAHDTPLLLVEGGETDNEDLLKCFVFGSARGYDFDPSWGFVVLSEVAQRALSPAVNDPGTAINVMTGMMKVLTKQPSEEASGEEGRYDRLSIKPEDCGKWVEEAFYPIARDGAGILEVGVVMQKVLAGIWRNAPETGVSQAAARVSEKALKRALQELSFEPDAEELRSKHEALFGRKQAV